MQSDNHGPVATRRKKVVIRLIGLTLLLGLVFKGVLAGEGLEEPSVNSKPSAVKEAPYDSLSPAKAVRHSRAKRIRNELMNPNSDVVLVIAHRGDWRNAPENSLQAISNSIALGVDIVEIDVRKTSDGHLVLIHDRTLDRTTTGTGEVSDYCLAELKQLRLKNGQGIATRHEIPTLEEAMLIAKDNIMVNLDKCYDHFAEALTVLKSTGTIDHAIIKGSVDYGTAMREFGEHMESVLFMPIVNLESANAEQIIDDYVRKMRPVAFEFVFKKEASIETYDFQELREKGSRVWVNTLWGKLNAGHDDDLAVTDIDASYGWVVNTGANMIQTDRPELLLGYLNSRGLRWQSRRASSKSSLPR